MFAVDVISSYLGTRILVDGVYLTSSGVLPVDSGGHGYLVLDFSGVGGRKPRTITVESGGNFMLHSVRVDPLSKVWAPGNRNTIRACFVGDSIIAGAYNIPSTTGDNWAVQLAGRLGWGDPWLIAVGGTGYVATGPGGNYYTFIQHVSDLSAANCQIVLIAGGINDVTTSANETAAALAYFRAVRSRLPSVPVIVFGSWAGNTGPSANVLQNEAAIAAAFSDWGDTNSYYVPVSNAPNGAWQDGTGTVAAPTGVGNSDIYVQPTGIHPIQAGINYIERRVEAAMVSIIAQIP